jgi:hypothetical protein
LQLTSAGYLPQKLKPYPYVQLEQAAEKQQPVFWWWSAVEEPPAWRSGVAAQLEYEIRVRRSP